MGMRLQLAGGRDYLSYSAISLYQACPLRFHFKYVMSLSESTVASSLAFGSAFHAAIQWHFETLMVTDRPASLDQLLAAFWADWSRSDRPAVELSPSETEQSIADQARRMLVAFMGSPLASPGGTILGIEEELRGPLVENCPDLLARVDLIVDQCDRVVLTDFKTSRSRWNEFQVSESAPQLWLYRELARSLAGLRPVTLAFAVVTKARSPRCDSHPVAASDAGKEAVRALIEQTWRAIERGEFPARPSYRHCPRCPYRAQCPAATHSPS